MLHIALPKGQRLVWYLAAEEYIAGQVQEPILMTWMVSPTVIFGRHQVMENEVNTDYCNSHHIAMYRRKSGGGCVYADEGNLMVSFITPDTQPEKVFQYYLHTMAQTLSTLGLRAVQTHHNDLLIADRKVSGNACYALSSGTIVHGTLLYSVDFNQLERAITPTTQKLAKHGVASVRQRVANLQDILNENPNVPIHSTADLSAYITRALCTHTRALTPNDITAISQMEKEYLLPAFIEGR